MRRPDLHSLVNRLPEDAVRRIERGGLVMPVVTRENGRLEAREIYPEQAWFWTPEWQEGEREANAQLAAGQATIYNSDEEFLHHLDSVPPASD
jgi:hypothetical protein